MKELGLPPKTARPNPGFTGQFIEVLPPIGNHDIPRIFPLGEGSDMQMIRQFRWNILRAVDGHVDSMIKKGFFDLFDEKSFPPTLDKATSRILSPVVLIR
jgi:hypothetical protein